MANHKSAAKRARQERDRRARNRAGRSSLRTHLKQYRALIAEGSPEAREKLPEMISLIDRSAKKGLIHNNVAGRLKSKLNKQTDSITAST